MLLTRNDKMKLTGPGFYTFEIGAGPKQCPGAKECATICYAKDGRYRMENAKSAHLRNYERTLTAAFVNDMIAEIDRRRESRRTLTHVRIHSSGDFYSKAYLAKWIMIMRMQPDVMFYCYTKMIPLFEDVKASFPKNFTWVYSYGGKWDHMIDETKHRHSKVFASDVDLNNAGYADNSHDDYAAAAPYITRVGLVYHGRFGRSKIKPTLGV